MKVKITKISECESPDVKTPDGKDYICGENNGNVSLPVDYWMEVEVPSPIIVGMPICGIRTSRNGINSFGVFRSSIVKSCIGGIAETMNSKYKIELLPEN